MNASQAIAKWQSEDTIDAFQPWEIVEMLDALAGRVIELEAAQQSAQADEPVKCAHKRTIPNLPGFVECLDCGWTIRR